MACLAPVVQGYEYVILHQQVFYALLEVEQTILRERKRDSIPGAVPQNNNVLFSREDLSCYKAQAAIKTTGCSAAKVYLRQCRFSIGTGP